MLTGTVPTEWRTMQRLRSLKLLGNKFYDNDHRDLRKAQQWFEEKMHPECVIELKERDPPPP